MTDADRDRLLERLTAARTPAEAQAVIPDVRTLALEHPDDIEVRIEAEMLHRLATARGSTDKAESSTIVFWSLFRSREPVQVGRAVLVDGEVRFTSDMAPGNHSRERAAFDTAKVFNANGTVLVPADGRRYFEALPGAFHGSYFWATLAEHDEQRGG